MTKHTYNLPCYLIMLSCCYSVKANNVFAADPGEGQDQAAFLFKLGSEYFV